LADYYAEAIVAGHICLDVIPSFGGKDRAASPQLLPGQLIDVGPAVVTTGGVVSNTGIALHRLGVPTKLMGKVGDDWFGQAILASLRQYGDRLASGMIVEPNGHSSYSIVLNPPNVDRIFLHCTGTNDTFAAADVKAELLGDAKLFHFGYPPLMRSMYADEGAELAALLSMVKGNGLTVSLDMAWPDPASEAGRADWRSILAKALPSVDVFLPSFEEIRFMLRREQAAGDAPASDELLSSMADELLEMGVAIVVIKLGEHGLYVKTTSDRKRIGAMGRCAARIASDDSWIGRELWIPCYEVEVVGTTGAGDCTIAGFLAGLLNGAPLEQALHVAVGVGACNVERTDATSGVPSWDAVRDRIAAGWAQKPMPPHWTGWAEDRAGKVFRRDAARSAEA